MKRIKKSLLLLFLCLPLLSINEVTIFAQNADEHQTYAYQPGATIHILRIYPNYIGERRYASSVRNNYVYQGYIYFKEKNSQGYIYEGVLEWTPNYYPVSVDVLE